MTQPLRLTPDQQAILDDLRGSLQPRSRYAPADLEILVEERLIRYLGDKIAINLARVLEREAQLKTAAPFDISTLSLTARKTMLNLAKFGSMTGKLLHPPTRAKLRDLELIFENSSGAYELTGAGKGVVKQLAAQQPPADDAAPLAHGSQPPLVPEIPHSTDPAPAVSLEITVESDTLPEAVETLHDIAAAIDDALPEGAEVIPTRSRIPGQTRAHVTVEVPPDMTEAEVLRLIQDRVASKDAPVEMPSAAEVDTFAASLRNFALNNAADTDCGDACTDCLPRRVLDLLMQTSPEIASVYERQAAIDRSLAKIRSLG